MKEMFLDFWNDPLDFVHFIETAPTINYQYSSYFDTKPDNTNIEKFRVGEKVDIMKYKCFLDDIVCEDKVNGVAVDIVGTRPIISRVLNGNPYNMFRQYKQKRQQLNLNIMLDMSVPANVSNGTIREIGQRVLATIEKLELEGHSLGLIAACGGSIGNFSSLMCVRLKDVGENLELTKICYPLSNPNFLRKFNFYWHCLYNEIKYMSGLGQPLDYHFSKDDISRSVSYGIGEKTLYLPFTLFRGWDEERIFKYIKEKLETLDNSVFLDD